MKIIFEITESGINIGRITDRVLVDPSTQEEVTIPSSRKQRGFSIKDYDGDKVAYQGAIEAFLVSKGIPADESLSVAKLAKYLIK